MKSILYPLIALLLTASSCSRQLYPVKPAASPYVQLKDGKKYMGAHAGKSGVNTGSSMHVPVQQIVMQNDKLAFADTAFALKDVAFYCTGNELYAHIFAKDRHTDAFSMAAGKLPYYAFAPQVAAGRVNLYNYKHTHAWLPGLYANQYYIQAADGMPLSRLHYKSLDTMISCYGREAALMARYIKTRANFRICFYGGIALGATGAFLLMSGTTNNNQYQASPLPLFGLGLLSAAISMVSISLPIYLSNQGRLLHIVRLADDMQKPDSRWN